jgi:hypothetical protein
MANEIELPIYSDRLMLATLLDPDLDPLDLTGAEVVFSVRENHSDPAHTLLDGCEEEWTAGNEHIVVSLVTSDKQKGAASILLTVAADASAEDILAHATITELDLSGHSSVHIWLKSSVGTDAGDLQVILSTAAAGAEPVMTLDVPALSAGVWKRCVMYFDDTYHCAEESLAGIVSVAIKMVVDKGAFTLAVDDAVAGKYLLEKVLGSNGADPTLGVATFALLAEHSADIEAAEDDYDIEVHYTATGVRYVPIIAKIEFLDHATAKD